MKHLISSYTPNQSFDFSGSDHEKLFRNNKKKMGKNWEYANKKIVYNYNDYGFRTMPFDKIIWQDSVVIFGCSNVEGMGLAEEDTISAQLEKMINTPVINLGLGGSGVDIACWNSLLLHNNYPRPRAVVQVWSILDRYTDIRKNRNQSVSYVPQDFGYRNNLNWQARSKFYIEADRTLWKGKLPYYEASCFHHTASKMNIDHFSCIDYARDLGHPGVNSARASAEKIAENLIKQGL